MGVILTQTDAALLSAQLAFVRRERLAQWTSARAFRSFRGAPTPRHRALIDLCDGLAADQLAQLHASPGWAALEAAGQRLGVEVLALVVERVTRYGTGLSSDELEILEACTRRRLLATLPPYEHDAADAHWWSVAQTGLVYAIELRDGARLWWPTTIPLAIASESLPAEVRQYVA
jgi:hypothetical protein